MSKGRPDHNTIVLLKKFSKRLSKALEIFRNDLGMDMTAVFKISQPEIEKNTGKSFSFAAFSKCHNYHEKPLEYERNVTKSKYEEIFKQIDPILERDCRKIWVDDIEMYQDKFIDKFDSNFLEGLIGNWDAYSWDSATSKKKKRGHIHKFSITIQAKNNIRCQTRENNFTSNKMILLRTGSIVIELNAIEVGTLRKIYLMIHNVNLALSAEQRCIQMAYVDSGKYHIKSGVAIMLKADFETVAIGTRPATAFYNTKVGDYIKYLRGKQFLIGEP